MTTVASNPSGRKSVKDKKLSPTKTVPPPAVTESINNQSEEFRNKSDKFQPTAEQMRIASLMSDKKDENDLKPKIEQIVELTGASRDDAAVALYDCDNDMTKAIEMILDGDTLDSEWQSTGRKKKTKAPNTNQLAGDALTNGNKKSEKSSRSNVKNNLANTGSTAVAKGQRGGAAAPNRNRKKDNRPNEKNENIEEDIFAKASSAVGDSATRRNGANRRGGLRPRGTSRGKGPGPGRGGSGSRTFMNRGLQNNDGFPNSIETWTNSTAEQSKPNDDLNTMTVGNWSDIAANEDWSEEDWTSAHMETKVFTPSTKVISEAEELTVDQSKSINNNSQQNASQLSFIPTNKNEESAQPTMSAILSGNIKRVPATAGQALLQQIQQQSSASQNSNLNQYTLSQYSKQATESIKSLVGLNSNNIISNEIITTTEDNLSSKQSPQASNQNRIKVPNRTSKIPESAVEMPSNDPVSNLSVHFGSLEFGANNSFSLGANDSNLFESVSQNKKPESKNISLLSSSTDNSSTSNFRPSNVTTNKPILPGPVLPQRLNDSMLNSDHRGDKTMNSNSYNTNKPQLDRKTNDYMNMNAYKSTYSANDNSYSAYQSSAAPSNMSYYSNSNQATPFGNSGAVSQSLIGTNNAYSSAYNNNSSMNHVNNNSSNVPKLRDMESNSVQQQQVSASSTVTSKPYDTASSIGTSLSLMSNSTVTTNVLKNTLSASKGVHNVPPGVQPAQVLSTPYIMGNTPGLPMPYPPYAYDVQFQNPRDHGYSPYATPDVKYNRGSESDMLPVSSQAAGAVQTATQAHNQYMNTYPPGYGFYFGVNFAHQGLYSTPQHPALYPVAQAQTTAQSAGSAFAKANTAANYGSHSYNSGYDSLGAAVAAAQTQDYVNKNYPQQLQQHKQLSGTNAGDLSGNNSQSIYNKTHSQINKNYDKQGFQTQAPQFNMSNTAQSAASLSSPYGGPYLLPHQQAMHHSLATAEPSQQPPGVGNQRNLSQTHKGSGSSTGNYGKFNWS